MVVSRQRGRAHRGATLSVSYRRQRGLAGALQPPPRPLARHLRAAIVAAHMATSDSPLSTATSGSPPPRSVLLGVPRWTRDGGVSAHVQTSAATLARHGPDVRV